MFGVCSSIWVEVMVFFSFISSFSFNVVTCCLIGLPMWGCPYWFVVELGLVIWYGEMLLIGILPSSQEWCLGVGGGVLCVKEESIFLVCGLGGKVLSFMSGIGGICGRGFWCPWILVASWCLRLTYVNYQFRLVIRMFLITFKKSYLNDALLSEVHSMLPESLIVIHEACEQFTSHMQPIHVITSLPFLSWLSKFHRCSRESLKVYQSSYDSISNKENRSGIGFGTLCIIRCCKQSHDNDQEATSEERATLMAFRSLLLVFCVTLIVCSCSL